MSDLRSLIRDVLREEVANIRAMTATAAPQVTEESVSLSTNADLNAFVHRILEMGQDGKLRADILNGRHQFRLGHAFARPAAQHYTPAPSSAPQTPAPITPPMQSRVEFLKGMVTERDINSLAEGTSAIRIAKSVRFTPLAKDEIRRRNIKIERAAA